MKSYKVIFGAGDVKMTWRGNSILEVLKDMESKGWDINEVTEVKEIK